MPHTTHADHQTMHHKHSLMEKSESWANSTPLWGLLNTTLDNWLINRPNSIYCSSRTTRLNCRKRSISCKRTAECVTYNLRTLHLRSLVTRRRMCVLKLRKVTQIKADHIYFIKYYEVTIIL